MKVDQRYHCFGCSEDGDVIDFTAKLFGLDLKEAAEKLAADFGIEAPFEGFHIEPAPVVKTGKVALEKRFNDCWRLYCEYLHLLKRWKEQYAPKITDEEWDDRFVEAAHRIDQVEYSLRHSSTTYKLKLNHGDLKATQGDTGHAQIDMITSVYAHILDEDRKINAQKFESAFYANPDLRSVRPPEEPKESAPATLDLEALVERLRKSPELANALAALLASAPSEK